MVLLVGETPNSRKKRFLSQLLVDNITPDLLKSSLK
jgi:hypothetical protein